MLGMKNHFDISGSIEIREVDIAGVACIFILRSKFGSPRLIVWKYDTQPSNSL